MRAAVQSLVSSFFSPTKRARDDSDSESISLAQMKRRKKSRRSSSVSSSDIPSHLEALERLQSLLLDLDQECTNEQISIQRKYDAKKKPAWDQRTSIISQIPDFWATAIGNHPMTSPHEKIFWKQDFPILSLLTEIELRDNLDDFGSFELLFRFDHDNNIYFSESQIIRKFIVEKNREYVTVTPVTWAPGKKPKSKKSFFYWLCSGEILNDDQIDIGDIFRTDLWQNPYPYYLNLSPDELPDPSIRSGTTEVIIEDHANDKSSINSD